MNVNLYIDIFLILNKSIKQSLFHNLLGKLNFDPNPNKQAQEIILAVK